jgi:GNAT superfamily N-acetyltransferase
MKFAVRALEPGLWPQFEALFGRNGACAGCWCMFWRLEKGERFEDIKGKTARQRMRAMVLSGKALGMLAFDGAQPVGWLSYGPRRDYPKLDRAPSLACDDADRVWSLPCFFIRRDYRQQGVATALLAAAIKTLRKRGVEIAEAYPVRPKKPGRSIPAAFAWTGTRSLFDAAGFEVVGNKGGGKERVRRLLAHR